jgi:hypothetical protein
MIRPKRYFMGLDLGQTSQFTALTVLSRPMVHPCDPLWDRVPAYTLGHLKRFPPGTPYAEVIDAVRQLLRTQPLVGTTTLVADFTSVGFAVLNMLGAGLRGVDCRRVAMVVTAGHGVIDGPDGLHVPRKELVGTLQVLLQSRRLQIPRSLPEADVLVEELGKFRAEVMAVGSESLEPWRAGQHDDLVLAVGIAAWMGQAAIPRGAAVEQLPMRFVV